ncbi:MAG: DUF4340 domain-containing protein [Bacteroidales bacterium]|nr:DUF4340 domain-containing protein [Bacteroidales bacterium]
MFKKLNVKVLIIILVILAAIYALSEFRGDKDRSFSRVLIAVDTAKVTEIHIHIPTENAEIQLVRNTESDWSVKAEGNSYPADYNLVKSILGQFHEIKPERIAATSKDRWTEYEVTDSAAIRVKVKGDSKNLADVYFGKFSYTQPPQGQMQQQQQQGKMTSFVRRADDQKVYAVEGFLRMTYQKDVNAYRNKTLVNVNKDDISRLEFTHPDFQFTVEKVDNRWMINNQPADSLKTVRYLSRLQRLTSANFVPSSTIKTGDAAFELNIEGNNFNPVELKAFSTPDTLINWVITSTMNPQAEFDGTKAQLFERTFVTETEFLPEPEVQ